jgi:NAD(P)-dependent dehydrogenase (short-subunit alcohol dehydrogenase family)
MGIFLEAFWMTDGLMTGKVVLITGATDGIGRAAASQLAGMGAEVVVVGRDRDKAEETVIQINAHSQLGAASYLLADLSSVTGVRKLAGDFQTRYSRLDVLVNNAGSAFMRRTITEDGFEKTFALNHLAYFLLTNLLLDMLKDNSPSRVVNVSSGAHKSGEIDFDDLDMEKNYFILRAYRRSKLANVLFTYALARRLEGSGVTANCLHPGLVRTGIFRKIRIVGPLVDMYVRRRAISVVKGAETIVYLASSPDVGGVSGKYFYKRKEAESSSLSHDVELHEKLWDVSAQRTGLG